MVQLFRVPLQHILKILSQLTGDGRQIYPRFVQTLKEFRRINIDSSIFTSSVQNLFQNHPDLLTTFKPAMPRHCSAAPPPEGSHMKASVDFLNRVYSRFRHSEVYHKFFECMHAYTCKEISAAEVCDKVVGLFGDDDDLVAEFKRFCGGGGSKKRKVIDGDQMQQQGKRKKDSDSGSVDEDQQIRDIAARRRRRRKSGEEENKAAVDETVERDDDLKGLLTGVRRLLKIIKLGGSDRSKKKRMYDIVN